MIRVLLILYIILEVYKNILKTKIYLFEENTFETDLTSITNSIKLRELDLVDERFKTLNLFNFLQLAKGVTIADGPFSDDLINHKVEITVNSSHDSDRGSTGHSNNGSGFELSDTLSTDGTCGSKKHQYRSSKSELIKTIEKQLMHKHVGLLRLRRSLDHLNTKSLIARVKLDIHRFRVSCFKMAKSIKLYIFCVIGKCAVSKIWRRLATELVPIYGSILDVFTLYLTRGLLNEMFILFYEARLLFTNKYIEKSNYQEFLFGCVELFKMAKQATTNKFRN